MTQQRVHEIRRGMIVARIRRTGSRNTQRHTSTVVRMYRNGNPWTESTRFGPDDIPLVRHVLNLAHTWSYQQCQRDES